MSSSSVLGKLIVRLLGDDSHYKRTLGRALQMTRKFGNAVAFTARAVAGAVTRIGMPLAALGGLAVREFGKFDQAMVESTSIMTGVTDAQKERMRELAKSMSQTAVQGPENLAKAYYFLASAGLDAAQSMKALPAVQKFATAGAFDMALATDLLTDAQSALGLTVKDAEQNMMNMTRVSDVLVKANTLANASVQQFSEALTSKSGAALKIYKKDVEEGVAVLAAYADQGVKASLAGENLNRVLLLLSKSAVDNSAAHKKYGLEVFDASGKMRNMADIITDLERITGGMSDETRAAALAEMGFEARVQGAILPLLGASDAIRTYEEQLRIAGGTTKDVADKQMQSFSNQMKTMWNTIKVLGIEIGEVLAPYVQKAALALKDWLGKNMDSITGKIKYFLKISEFVFANWRNIIDVYVNKAILLFMKLWNDNVFFWKTIFPALIVAAGKILRDGISRMVDNFLEMRRFMKDVFYVLPSVVKEVFEVVLNNAWNFGKALAAAIKGKGWNFVFEGLSDELKKQLDDIKPPDLKGPTDILAKHLADVPSFADRPLTDMEKQQQQYIDGVINQMGESWNNIMADAPKPEPEDVPTNAVSEQIKKDAEETEESVRKIQNLLFGSTEAVRAGTREFQELMQRVRPATQTPSEPVNPYNAFAGMDPNTAKEKIKGLADAKIPSTMSLIAKGIMKLVELEERKGNEPQIELEGMEGA